MFVVVDQFYWQAYNKFLYAYGFIKACSKQTTTITFNKVIIAVFSANSISSKTEEQCSIALFHLAKVTAVNLFAFERWYKKQSVFSNISKMNVTLLDWNVTVFKTCSIVISIAILHYPNKKSLFLTGILVWSSACESVNLAQGLLACLPLDHLVLGSIPARDEPHKLRLTTGFLQIRTINNGGLSLSSTITVYEGGYE